MLGLLRGPAAFAQTTGAHEPALDVSVRSDGTLRPAFLFGKVSYDGFAGPTLSGVGVGPTYDVWQREVGWSLFARWDAQAAFLPVRLETAIWRSAERHETSVAFGFQLLNLCVGFDTLRKRAVGSVMLSSPPAFF